MVKVFLTLFLIAGSAQAANTNCLAVAIFKEANTESLKGKRAVYDVIHNRMKQEGKTACQVLKRKKQFSFVTIKTKWTANESQLEALNEVEAHPKVLGSKYLWFYHKNIKPSWSNDLKCVIIGQHKFCKLKKEK